MPPKRPGVVSFSKRFVQLEAGLYFATCAAIIRPFKALAVASAVLVTAVLTVYLKYTVEGNGWVFAAVNAGIIVLGISLATLSTAMIVHDESIKDSSDNFRTGASDTGANPIDHGKHREHENTG